MRTRNETGAVTAEAAVVLPVLVLFALGLAWLVALGATQVRALDAARETARALARGEDPQTSIGLGARVATAGEMVLTAEQGDVATRRIGAARDLVGATDDAVSQAIVGLAAAEVAHRLGADDAPDQVASAERVTADLGIESVGWTSLFGRITAAVPA